LFCFEFAVAFEAAKVLLQKEKSSTCSDYVVQHFEAGVTIKGEDER
jgi:hypothetical protein